MYLSLSLRAWDCVASARRGLPLGGKFTYLLPASTVRLHVVIYDRAGDCVASARRGLPLGRKIYLLTYVMIGYTTTTGCRAPCTRTAWSCATAHGNSDEYCSKQRNLAACTGATRGLAHSGHLLLATLRLPHLPGALFALPFVNARPCIGRTPPTLALRSRRCPPRGQNGGRTDRLV